MKDLVRNRNLCINVGVGHRGKIFKIIGKKPFGHAAFFEKVNRLVIGNGGFNVGRIRAYGIIPVDMDFGNIAETLCGLFFLLPRGRNSGS